MYTHTHIFNQCASVDDLTFLLHLCLMIASKAWYWLWQSSSIVLEGYQHYLEASSLIPFSETEILSFQTAHGFKGQINFYKGTGDASAWWLWENILFMYLACKANLQWCIPFITFNTPCNLSRKALWWRGNISQCHLQHMSVHTAVSLGNNITISLSSLPYVIRKIKTGCQEKTLLNSCFFSTKSFRPVSWMKGFHGPEFPNAGLIFSDTHMK